MTTLRDLSRGEHKLIGEIIGESFADDPINCWIFGGPGGMKPYYTAVAKKLYLPNGYGHTAQDGSGGTMWLPSGVDKHIPLWNSMDIAVSMIRYGGVGSIVRGMSIDGFLAKRKPTAPHFYLFAIGTLPSRQGKGIGGALMTAGLERADRENKPVYLESSKHNNLSFYRHFGFEVIEKVVPARGCPPMWLMWREPHG
ncbi:MAG: GNAT family N-acetyltransferase [Halieaceae bacterium]|jgi:ribosomal protein S18 acetylase RimI-like enzyme|nr:GNAT family N-acetyltransferase [Halieaceae bacterium]